MSKVKCVICETQVDQEEITQFAAFGGLPNPCCKVCFQVNDYTCKSLVEVCARSLLRRIEMEHACGDELQEAK